MNNNFFTRKFCERCHKPLDEGRTMSIFNTQCICLECAEKEKYDPQYKEALDAELSKIKRGNYNYEGLRGDYMNNVLMGAIAGDIVGSIYEFNNIKTKNFPLFKETNEFTDDTIMTIAVADALLKSKKPKKFKKNVTRSMQAYGRHFYDPMGAYGSQFLQWLYSEDPQPYYSYGNGSAMRVSACAIVANSLDEAINLARTSAEVTHNHPEGLKGAEAVAVAIYLALHGSTIEEIKKHIIKNYYQIDFVLNEIRENYYFMESCQGSVPEALEAFFESINFEDAIRNAISIGGDSDTIACITGSIAGAYYGVPKEIQKRTLDYLPKKFINVIFEYSKGEINHE